MERTTCLIAGGGPAGIMLGLLLARAGVEVIVLEKHADFLRDFRGDTVHASTIQLIDELGLGAGFRRLPQSVLGNFELPTGSGTTVTLGDFGRLRPPYDYVAMIPQWDLLDFLVAAAEKEPAFSIRMSTEVTGLLTDRGRVTGVCHRTANGSTGTITADLTIACDGRGSVVRSSAGFVPKEFAVPFDTWWFRLPRRADEAGERGMLIPEISGREITLSLTRDSYYQVAYFAEKGADARLRAEGIESFRRRIARLRPDFADRVDSLETMDDVHMLDVRLNRLPRWYRDGLLCIGDAAHAMSPAGGVGINLAIQDAVAAATRLAGPLKAGTVDRRVLASIQRRRWRPMQIIQLMQRVLHRVIFSATFKGTRVGFPKAVLRVLNAFPALSVLPARLIAFGPRPEHAPDFARRPNR